MVNTGGFHGRSGFVRMPASFQVAITAKITGITSKSKGLIVAGKKDFPFQLHNDIIYVLRLAVAAMNSAAANHRNR